MQFDNIDRTLGNLLRDQQMELGAELNPLIKEVQCQSPRGKRAALLCMLSLLTNIQPHLPVTRWFPCTDEPKAYSYLLYLHDLTIKYLTAQNSQEEFLAQADYAWELF